MLRSTKSIHRPQSRLHALADGLPGDAFVVGNLLLPDAIQVVAAKCPFMDLRQPRQAVIEHRTQLRRLSVRWSSDARLQAILVVVRLVRWLRFQSQVSSLAPAVWSISGQAPDALSWANSNSPLR